LECKWETLEEETSQFMADNIKTDVKEEIELSWLTAVTASVV
jgi:hypothetical protein